MVKTVTKYVCEVCSVPYEVLEKAEVCEASISPPFQFKIGDKVRDKTRQQNCVGKVTRCYYWPKPNQQGHEPNYIVELEKPLMIERIFKVWEAKETNLEQI